MRVIPLLATPSQTFYIVLDGQYCTIKVFWRQKRLYLNLTVGSDIVCKGAICQNGVDIIQSPSQYFQGSLHFFDLNGDRAPQWADLNTRYYLIFVPVGETLPESLRY